MNKVSYSAVSRWYIGAHRNKTLAPFSNRNTSQNSTSH